MLFSSFNYDSYVNFLCTSGFFFVLAHSNSNNSRFQWFWGFLGHLVENSFGIKHIK